MEPKRYMLETNPCNQNFMDFKDPDGQWIFDPDHKIDLRNITSYQSRAAGACGCNSDTRIQCMFWDGEGGCVHPPRA